METVDALRARILADGLPLPDAAGVWLFTRPDGAIGAVDVADADEDPGRRLAWHDPWEGRVVFTKTVLEDATARPDDRRYLMVASR